MTDEERQTRIDAIKEDMTKLMQEFLNVTDDEQGSGLLTACVISFEATRFNSEGRQVYRTDHVCLDPTSYSASIGILQETLWKIHHDGFAHCHGGND